ncbi:MAG: NUDIX pyrophosphatase [Gammaproteobacteria bacterium]|nr:NUDIX pyrophosphatase [Gammaproteobacteria bacterium]NIR85271.1 NUDIX pyrophosphatase [Gammaproteobacteria bacterium]NIR88387.1 NUDIX pyrophosphatase [Gammaproteobacteria bacterium]NIU06337.1 NUDIX pyrophosphatase [Gammaproteobacteria bacterium]NIV53236.1 NUDIX domain-containing protein [Gammaproteobacteria bacterium]
MTVPGDELQQRNVVTAFLRHAGKILVVRRSGAVGTYQGRWSGISGYLETTPLEQALTEIREETGLAGADVELRAQGEPIFIDDPDLGVRWTVHPFLFEVHAPEKIRLDWENLEMRWIDPDELSRLETVPALAEAYRSCARGGRAGSSRNIR